jgi:hypothetical protein
MKTSGMEIHMTFYQIFGVVIFVVFCSVGIYLLNKSIKAHRKSKRATQWPTTTATVLESSMEEDPARNAMGAINVNYLIKVKYEYSVSGKIYQGERVTFGSPSFNFITASNISDQFAEGKQVPVSHDPVDPAESVLAPKNTVGMLSWVPGAFFVAVGFVIGFISCLM